MSSLGLDARNELFRHAVTCERCEFDLGLGVWDHRGEDRIPELVDDGMCREARRLFGQWLLAAGWEVLGLQAPAIMLGPRTKLEGVVVEGIPGGAVRVRIAE